MRTEAFLTDVEGDEGFVPGVRVVVELTDKEASDLLGAYEPNSPTSPSAPNSRALARLVLNTAREKGVVGKK
jgi:hypothetical protein